MPTSLRVLAALALATVASGCGPSLTLVSPAPPNRTIELRNEPQRVEISEGVAVAVQCSSPLGACTDVKAISSSPDIVGVYPAHIASVQGQWGYAMNYNAAHLAIVGKKPGETTLTVWSHGHASAYKVVVLPVAGVSPGGVAN